MILFNIITCNLFFTGMLAPSEDMDEAGGRRIITNTFKAILIAIGVLILTMICRIAFRNANVKVHKSPLRLAWAFNLVLFYGTLWSAAAYARCFDYADTINMIRTWLLSLGASWLIIEPLSAALFVGLPRTVGKISTRLEEMGMDPAMFF
jgi:hypothetical protein